MPRSGDEQPCRDCGARVIWIVPDGLGDARLPESLRRAAQLAGHWEIIEPPWGPHRCNPLTWQAMTTARAVERLADGREDMRHRPTPDRPTPDFVPDAGRVSSPPPRPVPTPKRDEPPPAADGVIEVI